ncbi:hypothetical protein BDW02DRAFT_24404 [Decorospora gaudefroyi]|uniref:Uncharacterized protein n=1 Tax=Decorospora gaudefroyi TaxID=184978 RepID=A0A6A5KC39_9PLEO|nr:hypothetical protein BDW02DRAFT_24404 [Decorospora gaudefroyi]
MTPLLYYAVPATSNFLHILFIVTYNITSVQSFNSSCTQYRTLFHKRTTYTTTGEHHKYEERRVFETARRVKIVLTVPQQQASTSSLFLYPSTRRSVRIAAFHPRCHNIASSQLIFYFAARATQCNTYRATNPHPLPPRTPFLPTPSTSTKPSDQSRNPFPQRCSQTLHQSTKHSSPHPHTYHANTKLRQPCHPHTHLPHDTIQKDNTRCPTHRDPFQTYT